MMDGEMSCDISAIILYRKFSIQSLFNAGFE